ncbi:hypothetical protein Dimus_001761, partial [Dionaea muscipula]
SSFQWDEMSKNVSFSSGSSSSTCPLLQPVRRFVPSSMNKAGDSTIEAMEKHDELAQVPIGTLLGAVHSGFIYGQSSWNMQ